MNQTAQFRFYMTSSSWATYTLLHVLHVSGDIYCDLYKYYHARNIVHICGYDVRARRACMHI